MNLLTATESHSNLMTLSERIANWAGNLKNHDVSASFCIALFLCLSFMVGILGGFRVGWFRDPVYQPDMPTAQSLVTFGGSNLKLLTEAVMPKNYAQSASSTELHLLEISQVIGSLIDSNCHFTASLAHAIDTNSTPLPDISLNEFIQLIKYHQDAFNTRIEQDMEALS